LKSILFTHVLVFNIRKVFMHVEINVLKLVNIGQPSFRDHVVGVMRGREVG
jgi:hypothetical protein